MKASRNQKISENFILPALSLCALAATFIVSISEFRFQTKLAVFLGTLIFYLAFCAAFYFRQRPKPEIEAEAAQNANALFNADVERQLLALEEASQFFGASLKPADMFRLVASRINEMIPFASAAIFRAQEEKPNFKSIGACGENARELSGLEINSLKGLAGKTFLSRKIQRDENLLLEKTTIPADALKNLESAIAAPLFRNGKTIFAVIVLYGDVERKFSPDAEMLLEAVAERIAPLFLSSLAFEQSLSNALTDTLTNLPNERAFYLILENQMAESQRQREQRPLTILTVDAKKFAELNQRFGHVTGDKILAFAAATIKAQLRKMDFLSRALSDEFLIVLPTASDNVTEAIVERIEKAFRENPFEIEDGEKIYLELNFGAATYLKDGDTAQQLLQSARLHKQAAKGDAGGNVLRFPKELVH
jgi:diguanylate cyclase (GGDEF)-like protein